MDKTPHGSRRGLISAWLMASLVALLLLPGARAESVRVDAVQVELIAPQTALKAGEAAWVGLRLQHDPHWHTYWRNPGDSGLATTLEVEAPAGVRVDPLQWPLPSRFLIAPLASYGYEDEVVLPFRVELPAAAAPSRLRLRARASWLMCREVCIPGEATLSLDLPVLPADGVPGLSVHAPLFERTLAALPVEKRQLPMAFRGDTLSIQLADLAGGAAQPTTRIEFFPYAETGLRHAAPQRILAVASQPERPALLELALSDDGKSALSRDPGEALRSLGAGVLVIGDQIREVLPRAAAAIPGGPELARVEAKPVVMPQQSGGLFAQLGRGSSASDRSLATGRGAEPADSRALGLMLLFAVLGGLILNLMPCVFPVIGLKVLAFAEHAHDPQAQRRLLPAGPTHGARSSAVAFAAGVVLSFLLLGVLMLALKAAGVSAGWGFQLQSPVFVSAMALLFVAIALNLSGVFEVGVGLTRLGRFDAAAHTPAGPVQRWSANLGSGALAVLVATPCTAPFMASALGFTLSSGPFESLAVFAAIGLGMSLPYLLLGSFPGWLRWLPRPGRWMESLRQFFAFPMFATAAWLAWVLGQQAGLDAVFALAVAAVLLGLGAWLFGRFVQTRGLRQARVAALAALIAVACAGWLALRYASDGSVPAPSAGSADRQSAVSSIEAGAWEPWSRQRVTQALAEGRPVFVDFTAAWCVSCQANKKLVLDRDAIVQDMARRNVLRLRADWTQRDPAITAELAHHGRNGVPLYLLYDSPSRPPRVLPELLTMGIVSDALGTIAPRR